MVFGSLHDLATDYGQDYHGANSTTYTENLNLIHFTIGSHIIKN